MLWLSVSGSLLSRELFCYTYIMTGREVYVEKIDGSQELFNPEKLAQSLSHAGASPSAVAAIVAHLESDLVDGVSTADIYRHAFEKLREVHKSLAARYNLRKAVLALGPTGFPFEKLVAEILKRKGFSVELDQIVLGKCLDHEVDVVAWNDEKLIMAEAKFHHESTMKSDIKAALYVKARFDDLTGKDFSYGKKRPLSEGWLVTNTKFTEKAISYSECAGVYLLGWNYPRVGNLHDLIDETGTYPITSLTAFSDSEKQRAKAHGVVLCRSVVDEHDRLREAGIDEKR